jgi:hypothetical protein
MFVQPHDNNMGLCKHLAIYWPMFVQPIDILCVCANVSQYIANVCAALCNLIFLCKHLSIYCQTFVQPLEKHMGLCKHLERYFNKCFAQPIEILWVCSNILQYIEKRLQRCE